jgi:hypothetical protein
MKQQNKPSSSAAAANTTNAINTTTNNLRILTTAKQRHNARSQYKRPTDGIENLRRQKKIQGDAHCSHVVDGFFSRDDVVPRLKITACPLE